MQSLAPKLRIAPQPVAEGQADAIVRPVRSPPGLCGGDRRADVHRGHRWLYQPVGS